MTTDLGMEATTHSGPTVGDLTRAGELVLAAVGGSHPEGAPRHFEFGIDSPRALAGRLGQQAGIDARVRTLATRELARLSASHGILARTPAGWLVAHRGGGTVVDGVAERRVGLSPRALRRLGLGEQIEAVVLEPRMELEVMANRTPGSDDPWARMRAFVGLERRHLLALVAYAIVLGGLSLAVPIAVQVMVNTIAFGALLQPLVVLSLLLLGVLTLSGLIQVFQWYAVELLQRRIFVRVAEDFTRRLLAVQFEAHDHHDPRELINRFFEVPILQKAVGGLLLDGLALALQTAVGLVLLGFYHPALLAFDALLVLAFGGVVALGAGAVTTARKESKAKYAMMAWLEVLAGNPDLFKRDDAALFGARRADVLVREYLGARRVHYRGVMRQLAGGVALQIAAMVGLLGLGGVLVMRGELTLGQLIAAELVVGAIGVGIAKVGKHFEKVYDLIAGIDKISKVVDLPIEAAEQPADGPSGPLSLSLDAVRIPWDGQDAGCEATASLSAGEKVQLLADSRHHGRLMMEVLAGLRSHRSGALVVDGDRNARARAQLRKRALLLRPGHVFAGTVMDNLRLDAPELTAETAWQALEQVGLAKVVAELPQGLETELSSAGAPLTTEQQTRLSMAGALVAGANLLLVDRALDDLTLGDAAAVEAVERLIGPDAPWTAVVVTERAEIAERCTRVVDVRGRESAA